MCNLVSNRCLGTGGVVVLIVLGACASVGGSQAPTDVQRMTSSMILSFDNVMDKNVVPKKIMDAKFEDSHSNAQYVELLARRNRCEPIGDAILITQEGDLTKYRMGCKNGDMLFQCKPSQQSSYPFAIRLAGDIASVTDAHIARRR